MNKMSEVANLCGVNLNESFKIEGYTGDYQFTADGLVQDNSNKPQGLVLSELLTGNLTIQRYPWKPKQRDMYYYIAFDYDFEIRWREWGEFKFDILNYKIGNCYLSRNDAMQSIPKWEEFFKNDRVLGYV